MAGLSEEDLRAIALVRAIEQTRPDLVAQTALVEATLVAGDPARPEVWLTRRARHLLEGALHRFRPALEAPGLRLGTLAWAVPIAFVAGLAGNYLGPSRKIHVLFNPIGLLTLWNLGVYAALLLRRGLQPASAEPAARSSVGAAGPERALSAGGERTPRRASVRRRPGPWERIVLGGLLHRAVVMQGRVQGLWGDVRAGGDLVRTFVADWIETLRPALGPAVRATLHLAAMGLSLGAIGGMYVRGLFLDYFVVWRSTFLSEPGSIALVLRIALAPAAWLLGEAAPTVADATHLLTPEGSPAARWIHLLAVSGLLAITLPRLLLGLTSLLVFRRALSRLSPSLEDPYVQDLLARAGRLDLREVKDGIRVDVGRSFESFVGGLADFVAEELHERRIEPVLDDFRAQGGRVADLEEKLRQVEEAFEPVLRVEIGRRRQALEQQVAERVTFRLGAPSLPGVGGEDVLAHAGGAASRASWQAGRQVGGQVATGVSAVVTGAVGAAAGTVSGGFGHSVGTALLVGIVHSGPIAWILGAVAGAVATAAGLYFGQERLREGVKRLPLPAAVAWLALLRIEKLKREGRDRCRRTVRVELQRHFEEEGAVEQATEAIWSRLLPLLGEHLRPQSDKV